MIFKFFEKWKEKRLNRFAKKAIKNNPPLAEMNAVNELRVESNYLYDMIISRFRFQSGNKKVKELKNDS